MVISPKIFILFYFPIIVWWWNTDGIFRLERKRKEKHNLKFPLTPLFSFFINFGKKKSTKCRPIIEQKSSFIILFLRSFFFFLLLSFPKTYHFLSKTYQENGRNIFVFHCREHSWKVGFSHLSSHTFQQIGLTWGVERELEKLEETLSTIKAVLLDAEDRQSKEREVSLWLERLKDVCYDAEDVLDEFAYEALRKQVVARGSLKTKVHNFFSHSDLKFRFVMGRKIKAIRERLDEISANKAKFHLTERDGDWPVVTREREMTHSFIREVIGRDVERENIIELLTSRDIDKNFSVVPIVGMGGLGKTTVAKMVYDEERVKGCFELRMWVCVSDDFSLKTLTKAIIESATKSTLSDYSIDQLQYRLRDTLRGRKFLLVLDDVWNEEPEKWDKLKELLLDGANGSKIVVTTRSHSVASIMGTAPPCILQGLSDEDCWSLFVKCAFKAGQEEQHPNLEKIGKQIVSKCRGVPLAVKSLGSLLFMKIDESDWMHIKNNEIWKLEQRGDFILPALKLSYKHLPSYLKQCFTFCSLFPKDHMFNSDVLVELWIAQSYIHPSNENEKLEDIGMRYIKELWSRSFFQDMEDHDFYLNFKMHDLVHDLALLVAQNECYTINSPKCDDICKRVRHVSFPDQDLCNKGFPEFLLDQKKLRTILFPISGKRMPDDELFLETCTARFKYLRLLDCRHSSLKALPSCVGTLKHLRTLNLSYNETIKKLPNSVCKLFNLQTLDLSFCYALEELPRDIGNLMSLRRLRVTTRQAFLQLDKGIGRLTSLQELSFYQCDNLRSLGEGMERLTSLRTLLFYRCGNLESLPRSMKFISAGLEVLHISGCEKLKLMELDEDDFMFTNLRRLLIWGLPQLESLPGWLQGAADTLRHLWVWGCDNLTALPEWLQNFTSLQTLEIRDCNQLSGLPENMRLPASLRELEIEGCPRLRRRCERETGEDWHKIAHIPNITLKVEDGNPGI